MDRDPEIDTTVVAAVGLLLATAVGLYLMGREPWGTAEGFGLWTGDIESELNSQRLADPYSFTHIVHGLVIYLLLWVVAAHRLGERARLLVAVGVEGVWEFVENTPYVIERFREATIAHGYYGDSILNSLGDVLAMIVGFTIAMHLRNRWVVALFVGIELILLIWLRDNMTLNLIMLVYPIPGLREWQAGG